MNEAEKEKDFQRPNDFEAYVEGEIPNPYDIALEDINPVSPRLFAENRYGDFFKRLREEDPVHFNQSDLNGRYWSLTKYEDIKAVDADWENFTSAHGITIGVPVDHELPSGQLSLAAFIAMDPPTHGTQRNSVGGAVGPRNLARMEPLIRQRTQDVLDSIPHDETFDWVDAVSVELTTRMLATLVDFPFDQRRRLTRWSDVATAVPGSGIIESEAQRRSELLECLQCFTQLREERRQNPGNDLVSMLAQCQDENTDPMEFLGNMLVLIVGGNDTTRNSMTASIYCMDKWPDQLDALKMDGSLIPKMVSELIRWQTPLSYMRRTANRDCEIRGKHIKKGDQVLMWYVSGNRDEDVFENAEAFDMHRPNARSHLSFGFGVHRCMGNRLAELQLRILWEELLPRFERIEVVAEPERTLSAFVKGYTHMPVRAYRVK